LNSQHIKLKYAYISEEEKWAAVERWRKFMLDTFPSSALKIQGMDPLRMLLIMDSMKSRLRFLHEIKNHAYFFQPP